MCAYALTPRSLFMSFQRFSLGQSIYKELNTHVFSSTHYLKKKKKHKHILFFFVLYSCYYCALTWSFLIGNLNRDFKNKYIFSFLCLKKNITIVAVLRVHR